MANGRDVEGASASANQNTFSAHAAARVRPRALLGAASRLTLALLLGGGAAFFASPAFAGNINVANSAQLISALNTAAAGDTITFTQNITLASAMPQLTKDVTINGGGFQLNGANTYQGFAVLSGTVAINNLKITNAVAQGGRGGDTYGLSCSYRRGGGGGAGLGGGLFVGQSAKVTVTNVSFGSDQAIGGVGGQNFRSQTTPGGGGGGGMFGNGGNSGNGYGGLGAPAAAGMAARSTVWARRRASSAAAAAAGLYRWSTGQDGGFGGGGGGTGELHRTTHPPGKGGWGGSDGNSHWRQRRWLGRRGVRPTGRLPDVRRELWASQATAQPGDRAKT